MTRRAGVLDDLEPEAVAFMSPGSCAGRACGLATIIKTRDAARHRSSEGAFGSDVPENMVFMPFCYAEAAANLLTNPALDPFGKIPSSSSVPRG